MKTVVGLVIASIHSASFGVSEAEAITAAEIKPFDRDVSRLLYNLLCLLLPTWKKGLMLVA
jgi:hypothetical protein